ncbi:MAG TPA: divalent-cation tolerance protein CutA [Opitutus sp.]|nr:divalent-cation tolerance protein CutA [Opitutus sp.]
MLSPAPKLLIAWTTVAQRHDAERLASAVVAQGLSACVQIDGPVISHYRWQGKVERAEEFRLTFKFLPDQLVALERHVRDQHPYETPEWIVLHADAVAEKYLSWASTNPSTPPL